MVKGHWVSKRKPKFLRCGNFKRKEQLRSLRTGNELIKYPNRHFFRRASTGISETSSILKFYEGRDLLPKKFFFHIYSWRAPTRVHGTVRAQYVFSWFILTSKIWLGTVYKKHLKIVSWGLIYLVRIQELSMNQQKFKQWEGNANSNSRTGQL